MCVRVCLHVAGLTRSNFYSPTAKATVCGIVRCEWWLDHKNKLCDDLLKRSTLGAITVLSNIVMVVPTCTSGSNFDGLSF